MPWLTDGASDRCLFRPAGLAGANLILKEKRGHQIGASRIMRLTDDMEYNKRIDKNGADCDDDTVDWKPYF